ncbi:DUF397 domain-containing protein [Nocardia sp. NBC_00416]|uniref:DUF397 domain-containing protein n=1 Tax=Nocardia sp. NBC_00416 TaxID=2975991 RepID=UPI002E1A4A47
MRSRWFKSSFSGSEHTCVEVRFSGKTAFIRDSKYLMDPRNDPAQQPVIELPVSRWEAFLVSVVGPAQCADPALPRIASSAFGVSMTAAETTLLFTVDEWAAFVAGVAIGEFAAA